MGGGGSHLKSDFQEGSVTKIFTFALKVNGVVGRVAHPKSSDPATSPSKKNSNVHKSCQAENIVTQTGTSQLPTISVFFMLTRLPLLSST